MSTTGNRTLDRIQQEIKENLLREEELRKEYTKLPISPNDQSLSLSNPNDNTTNGSNESQRSLSPDVNGNNSTVSAPITTTRTIKTNGFRRFSPNPSARGVMQKFLRMRGKININNNNNNHINNNNNVTINESNGVPDFTQTFVQPIDSFEPAKYTLESGKPIRNGYVSAEEKMRRELLDFQQREAELRKERRKSQPDLMAALEAETDIETNLKPARSMVQLYSNEDLTEEPSSAPSSLKPAKSLADLCDAVDDELETPPGTHSLIMQFESMKTQQDKV